MKALQTQFDDKRLSNAVATPTCSSCCCCCCCLATSIAASSLLAQRVAREGERHQIHNRHLLTVVAALFVPLVGALVYLSVWMVNGLMRTCTDHVIGVESYAVCSSPGTMWVLPLLLVIPFLVLWLLYTQVRIEHPAKRAALVTALMAIAFTAEFFGGAALILSGIGGVVYLILIPIIVGWISVWYHRHIGKNASDSPALSTQIPYQIQPTERHDENPTKPEEPPQPHSPASSPK